MDKLSVRPAYNEVVLKNPKERGLDSLNNIDES